MYWTKRHYYRNIIECTLMSESDIPIVIARVRSAGANHFIGMVVKYGDEEKIYYTTVVDSLLDAMDLAKEKCQILAKTILRQKMNEGPKFFSTSSDGPTLSFIKREEYDEFNHDELILRLYHYKKIKEKYGFFDNDKQIHVHDYHSIKSLNRNQLEIYEKNDLLLERYKNEIEVFEKIKGE